MALQAGCTTVTIMDVDAGRVNYALENKFATHGYRVPCHSDNGNSNDQMRKLNLPNTANSSPSSSGTSTPSISDVSETSTLASSANGVTTPFSDIPISSRLHTAKTLALAALSQSQTTHPSDVDDDEEDIGFDCTFECTGKEACMQTALYATRPGGKVIMVGMGTPIQILPMSASHLREVDILGIFRYCNTYAEGIKLLESGRLPSLDAMVTHRFRGLERAGDAFELAGRTKDDEGNLVLKVVIEC